MHKIIKDNPLSSIIAVLTIISMLSGGAYSVYNVLEKLDNFVTQDQLQHKADSISIEILNVAIMRYEDDLMRLEIKIQLNTADDYDKAQQTNILRRLSELKAKKLALEVKTAHD